MVAGQRAAKCRECDFQAFISPTSDEAGKGDVRTYCTETMCDGMPSVLTSPLDLQRQITETLKPGVRAFVGNAGCELTFRHVFGEPKRNVQEMLRWAGEAFDLIGDQLVLAPMDYDLIHDVMTGAALLAWASHHRVPLAVFCGYRFFFPEDAFAHIKATCVQHPMNNFENPYCYPYTDVSRAILDSGAELWTGAGFIEGIRAGAVRRAEEFGFAGVLTSTEAWEASDA
jgi:hypothetical protein